MASYAVYDSNVCMLFLRGTAVSNGFENPGYTLYIYKRPWQDVDKQPKHKTQNTENFCGEMFSMLSILTRNG